MGIGVHGIYDLDIIATVSAACASARQMLSKPEPKLSRR